MKKYFLFGMLMVLVWGSVAFGRPWVGFFPAGCEGCHGFPPQRPGTASNKIPPEENYAGGGGPHVEHVNFLEAEVKLCDPTFDRKDFSKSVRVLCAPCHGEEAPHHGSGNGIGVWPISARVNVDIGLRLASSWGGSPKYDNRAIPAPSLPRPLTAIPTAGYDYIYADDSAGTIMNVDNSRCTAVDCHNDDTSSSTAYLSWYVTTQETDPPGEVSGARGQDAPLRTRICYDCHKAASLNMRVYGYGNQPTLTESLCYGKKGTIGLTNFFDPQKIDAAGNYYGTVSGYGRGGHGDPKFASAGTSSGLDVNSDTGHKIDTDKPIDCTACHDWQAAHFPIANSNQYRLRNTTVENSTHNSTGINVGLCNECHDGNNYPGLSGPPYKHHPSFVSLPSGGAYANKPVVTLVNSSTSWSPVSGTYVQNAYSPFKTGSSATYFGTVNQNMDVDYFTDWYNRGNLWTPGSAEDHVQNPEPRGVFLLERNTDSPKATLPLTQHILGTNASTDNRIMCVTCHNPHGTDLYVHDTTVGGVGKSIPDHNMLRLQDTDNTLCVACH